MVAALKARIEEVPAEDLALNRAQKEEFTRGMLGQCRIRRRWQLGEFELALDEGRVRCSYVLRNGGHYFTDVLVEDFGQQPGGLRSTFLNERSRAVAELADRSPRFCKSRASSMTSFLSPLLYKAYRSFSGPYPCPPLSDTNPNNACRT